MKSQKEYQNARNEFEKILLMEGITEEERMQVRENLERITSVTQ